MATTSNAALSCGNSSTKPTTRLGIPLEERRELAEGSSAEQVFALLEDLGDSVPALSTHGDVIADLVGWDKKCKKGSIWVLELDGRDVRSENYLPPA